VPDKARLAARIETAAARLAPAWPLDRLIAVNPLQGLEDRPFEAAVAEGAALFGGTGYPGAETVRRALDAGDIDRHVLAGLARRHGRPGAVDGPGASAPGQDVPVDAAGSRVNRHLIAWLTAFLDEGQAAWPMPGREDGFYAAWRRLAIHDPALPDRERVADLPQDPLDMVRAFLATVPDDERESVILAHLAALPGWSSYIRWRADARDHAWQAAAPITLADYLAVRMALARLLGDESLPAVPPGPAPGADAPIWLEAWEETWRRRFTGSLRDALDRHARYGAETPGSRAAAQLVFCIDVRSEVLRRHLEAAGPYETLGFAGFFGLPMAFRAHDAEAAHASCPVLLQPKHLVADIAMGDDATLAAERRGRARLGRLKALMRTLKASVAGAFAFVEATGLAYGATLVWRTLAPAGFARAVGRLRDRLRPPVETRPQIDLVTAPGTDDPPPADVSGIAESEQIFLAEAALRIMGLTRNFAPLVVLCGHGAETVNNPFAAGLDCGACGGHRGGPNARALAAILEKPSVRTELAARGIAIPADTVFLGAEHNTTTDAVTLFAPDAARARHAEVLDRLVADLARARRSAAAERVRRLPGGDAEANARADAPAAAHAAERAADWAQVRPEWGLARNAAFVVGPRALTRDLDLEGRAFLHSYDWRGDAEGKALEVVLTAPMVVAQWINSQYYFSTVDPVAYGAGSKVTHSVVGTVGVVQGNGSDLMTGLPLQSVHAAAGRVYHQPLRLLTVVEAPLVRVEAVIARNPILRMLFGNGWVALMVADPESGRLRRRSRDGTWYAAETETPPGDRAVPGRVDDLPAPGRYTPSPAPAASAAQADTAPALETAP